MEKKSKLEPRHVNERTWYYVNQGSVDLVTEHRNAIAAPFATLTRLTRKTLQGMLSELAPVKGRR